MSPYERDPETGKLLWPVGLDIYLPGSVLPMMVGCKGWVSAAAYLTGAEFRKIRKRVRRVQITNREAS